MAPGAGRHARAFDAAMVCDGRALCD